MVKEFEGTSRSEAAARIGGLEPQHQNRDGAAIRHATRKLVATGARVQLLILISDGKPLDDGYAEEYALDDTKMALREAVGKGVDPYCLTIDREAEARCDACMGRCGMWSLTEWRGCRNASRACITS